MRRLPLLLALLLSLLLPAIARAEDPPPPATEIAQQLSLQQAASAGILDLRAKGGFGGDSVAVDLTGARVPGTPVGATVRIEFLGTQKDGSPWPQSKADEIAAEITRRLAGSKASDGSPFTITVEARVRSGADAQSGGTPGYHQIVLTDRPRASDASMVSPSPFGPNGEKSGDWGVNETATTLAHETGHLLGLPDRYSARKPDWIGPDGRHVKLPEYKGDRTDTKALDAWWRSVQDKAAALDRKYGRGDVQPGIPRGGENDIMADGTGYDHDKPIIARDIDALIAKAGVRMKANPGDVILNKDGGEQNFIVGAPLDLFAPKGQTAHRDGLFAYCIDLGRHIPVPGARFDVLGPAAGLAGTYPTLDALRRLAETVAAQPSAGLAGPTGANDAFWAVSDGSAPSSDEGRALLAAAGVTFDEATFKAGPHFSNPNAGAEKTAGVTTDGVLPALPADTTAPPPEPVYRPVALSYLKLAGGRVRAGRRTAVTVRSLLDGPVQRWSVTLLRRGKPAASGKALPLLTLTPGPSLSVVRLPKLKAGRWLLVLRRDDGGATRRLAITAAKPARAKAKQKRRPHARGHRRR
ncbi:hypothetical protein Q5424_26280 [Conexibacter sp. JD483]|uniref:hypothetical protein n=1 Tax=unclassified Conexibacter TaxID=2627773 RepID=UPI00271A88BC|nr:MULTISPECIES: hypothetical protein [unclassified Conexibacter]MDO8189472.1 hypothetical protein [Conexibacter sp. CPCC 205706]MDO8202062.1 hypothetical protein [Conexibacter sp. CPCC 205762]MDR9372635.1 hypothetical protein [Conexibacter sp. JD483]